MSLQRTLSIIKPDATSRNIIGKIIDRFEENGLKVVAAKLIHMDEAKAAGIAGIDIVSVTNKFLKENPGMVSTFIEVTHEANAAHRAGKSNMNIIAKDAGMSLDATKGQIKQAFVKSLKGKKMNKKILSEFIELVV